ncbi:MAG: tetratricopeptide repeat protein [Candidatus Omnitrophica bacterium]|nr:tetratricopeptide repeat protein [Candidatus Omnitrophota bacterium]
MPHALKSIFVFVVTGMLLSNTPSAHASFSSHPLQDYEQGIKNLQTYRGDKKVLQDAQLLFSQIIEKHPDSPFGYLGMSQLKIVQAYRYGQHYNIKMITEEALPMALKAMRSGPTLIAVHDHYDRFEAIFRNNDESQDQVRKLLFFAPEKPATYLALGDYLSDQGDFEKALEYYKIALRFAADDTGKLIAIQRIARIYLIELPDANLAVKYYKDALTINEHMPTIWEDLGAAYSKLQQYDLSIEYYKKALSFFHTSWLQQRLFEVQLLAHEQAGKLDLAIQMIREAIDVNSQNTSLHRQIGNLYYKNNSFHEAYAHFQQAIAFGMTDPELFYFAGQCAYLLGFEKEAKDYYFEYLQLRGEGQQAQWIRHNIEGLSQR